MIKIEQRKTKQPKDKDAPKRATSAFFFYQKIRRAGLKVEQPSLDNKSIVSKMSEEWNKMTETEKEQYKKLADTDKARYTKEKEEYQKKNGNKPAEKKGAGKSASKTQKKSKDDEDEDEDDDEEGDDDEE